MHRLGPVWQQLQFTVFRNFSNEDMKCSLPAPELSELAYSLIELVSILLLVLCSRLSRTYRYDRFTCTRVTEAHRKTCTPAT